MPGSAAARCSSFDCIVAHWVDRQPRHHRRPLRRPISCALCGVDRAKLPELVPSATVVGEVTPALADEWGLAAGTKVVTATGDVHSAVVGSGAIRDFEGHLYIGTSSWLSCPLPWKKTDLLHNQAALPSPIPGRYFLANEHEVAGAALLWLRDYVQHGPRLRRDERARRRRRDVGSGKVIFTPWLNGERTPVDDHTIRGGWNNLSLSTTPGRSRALGLRGCGVQLAMAARRRREVRQAEDGRAQLHRRGRAVRRVVPDARRCAQTHDSPGGGAAARQCPRGARSWRASPSESPASRTSMRRCGSMPSSVPDPSNFAKYDELYREFRNRYKADKAMHARLNDHS